MSNLIRRNESGTGVTGWDPWRVMEQMLRFDPFREIGSVGSENGSLSFMPSFEVKERKDGYVVRADLPGVSEKDIDISLTGNRLNISGKREEEKQDEGERFFAYERSYGTFSRSFTLPSDADTEKLEADLKEGVLTVSVPKRPELQPKKIALKDRMKNALKG